LAVLVILFISACNTTGGQPGNSALIEKSGYYRTLMIPKTGLEAPEGKQITVTKDGVEIKVAPEETYKNVYVTLTDDIPVQSFSSVKNNYILRAAAYISDNKPVAEKSVSKAVISGKIDKKSADNIVIDSQNDYFNGIIVDGNTVYTITNPSINLNGHGGDDFAGYGAGIMATGDSNVVVENAKINTTGAIRTAIWAGGNALLLVKNSEILASDGDNVDFPFGMMNEVPWILGLKGNLRATNVLGAARATYLNSRVAAENWGALSTDSNYEGASLTAINTDIIIYGESGYGSYADMAVQNYYYGSRFDVPTYGLIVAAGACGAVFAKSSLANVGEGLYQQIPAEHRDEVTTVKSGGFGVMWHQNKGGTVTVKEKTEFDCEKTIFLIKSSLNNTAVPNIVVDDAVLDSASGVILHLMESDDPGMGGGPPGSATLWAKEYVVPVVNPQPDPNNNTAVENENTVKAAFSNMTVNGNIYNSRWTAGQNLSVTFDRATVRGLISAGRQYQNGLNPGDKITKATYYKISDIGVTPAAVVNSGLLVTLENGSTWTVTGNSYISKLVYGSGCTINAAMGKTLTVKVNGIVTTISAGNTYTGNIEIVVN
jgi:hypothetical protein